MSINTNQSELSCINRWICKTLDAARMNTIDFTFATFIPSSLSGVHLLLAAGPFSFFRRELILAPVVFTERINSQNLDLLLLTKNVSLVEGGWGFWTSVMLHWHSSLVLGGRIGNVQPENKDLLYDAIWFFAGAKSQRGVVCVGVVNSSLF